MCLITVLVADDDPYIRQCIRHATEIDPDLRVECEAENGLQALMLAERHRPDVVLLDAEMPRMDGMEAARCLRKSRPDVCIIIMSVYEELRSTALEAGADAFILKGCGCSQLRSLLHQVRNRKGNAHDG